MVTKGKRRFINGKLEIDGYIFRRVYRGLSSRTIVASKGGDRSEEEREHITKIYAQNYEKYGGTPLTAKWRFCQNGKCQNYLLAPPSNIKRGRGIYCSSSCSASANNLLRKKRREFCQWFLNLNLTIWEEFKEAARWVVNTAHHRDPESIKRLDILLESEEGIAKVKETLEEIYRFAGATRILKEFLASKEGEKLRSLIK